MHEDYDIIVTGAGLVGTSLVSALQNADLRIAVLETHLPMQLSAGADCRPLSLAHGSQKILETLGIWRNLAEFAQPIKTVHVSEQKQLGALRFHAAQEGVPALGYVVPFDLLQNILYRQAAQMPQVKFIAIQKLMRIQNSAEKVQVTAQTIDGEKTWSAALLVAADGAHSPARALLNIPASVQQNDDVALMLTVELSRPHQSVAYERFTSNGVIAVLPLQQPQRCRIVWTLPGPLAQDVRQWPDAALADYLRAAMRDRLGAWRVLERGKALPLQTVLAEEQIRPGVVLLGNAAHTIYPLAAQGFNLGLRDAAALAEVLLDARRDQQALGGEAVLKSYLAWRRDDQRWISGLTSGVSQLFELQIPGLAGLRSAGLLAADLIPPLKRRLARRLLGMAGKCPKLARGIAL